MTFTSARVVDIDVMKTESLTKPFKGLCVLSTVDEHSWSRGGPVKMTFRVGFYLQNAKWIPTTVETTSPTTGEWTDLLADDPSWKIVWFSILYAFQSAS